MSDQRQGRFRPFFTSTSTSTHSYTHIRFATRNDPNLNQKPHDRIARSIKRFTNKHIFGSLKLHNRPSCSTVHDRTTPSIGTMSWKDSPYSSSEGTLQVEEPPPYLNSREDDDGMPPPQRVYRTGPMIKRRSNSKPVSTPQGWKGFVNALLHPTRSMKKAEWIQRVPQEVTSSTEARKSFLDGLIGDACADLCGSRETSASWHLEYKTDAIGRIEAQSWVSLSATATDNGSKNSGNRLCFAVSIHTTRSKHDRNRDLLVEGFWTLTSCCSRNEGKKMT